MKANWLLMQIMHLTTLLHLKECGMKPQNALVENVTHCQSPPIQPPAFSSFGTLSLNVDALNFITCKCNVQSFQVIVPCFYCDSQC